VALLGGLSLGVGSVPPAEEIQMKLGAMVAVSSFALSQVAAGQAVQWKVSEGGNGHWYEARPVANWFVAVTEANARGGYLACISNDAENSFVRSVLVATPAGRGYLGLEQLPNQTSPTAGWGWTSGEPYVFQNWTNFNGKLGFVAPDDTPCSVPPILIEDGQADVGMIERDGRWDDMERDQLPCNTPWSHAALIEWSADCNNDGIVDYGQCRDGSLPDYNGNNIPDCCEQGAPCVVGTYPIEWRVEDGGHGNWYYWPQIEPTGAMWTASASPAQAPGFKLVVLEDAVEEGFLADRLNGFPDYSRFWIGHYRVTGSTWAWRDGATSSYLGWGDATCGAGPYPNYGFDGFLAAALHRRPDCGWNWDDFAPEITPNERLLLEASADCNNDGIVDYGQILLGQTADVDANGVPDLCEAYEVPGEFSTIQAAINAVPVGQYGLVLIAAGTRSESFSLNGKNVRVQGAPNNATILDGTGLTTSIARFTGGEPATAGLANLVFRNGTTGSRITPKATFTVGGAVYGLNSAATIKSCRFEQNEADFGGAVYLLRCDSAVEACVFAGNEALTDGGAFFAYECAGFVRSSDFTANSCGASGSGNGGAFKTVGAKTAGGTFLLQDCSITGTISGVDGAAVQHFENSSIGVRGNLRIVDTDISANSTSIGAGGVRNEGPQLALILAGTTSVCGNAPRNVGGPFLIEGTASVCGCLADVTGDGQVNGGDLGIVLNSWGGADALGSGDVNHDGVIDGSDLSIVLSNWGACGN
jgi:hypothetical protein